MIQLQFINRVLNSKDTTLITLNNLNDSYFPEFKDEFNFIYDHIKKYGVIPDTTTFLTNFNNFKLIEVNETNEFLVSEIFKYRKVTLIAEGYNEIATLVKSDKIDEAVKKCVEISENLITNTSISSVDIFKDVSRYDAFVERTQDFNKFYVKTGFKELDKAIGGWDREEELATIVAKSGVGKTWTLLKCALASAEQGLNVGIYSGEMSERKVGYRIDTLLGHISNGSLIHGNDAIKNDYRKYIEELPNKVKGTIKVLTPYMINGPAGVNSLRAFIEKEKLDILFIDQHSLLEDDRKAKSPVERASNISRDLKNLQVLKKIPIISVSQQNRSSVEAGVSTDNIAQSDRIGQDSTIVLFIEKKDSVMTIHLVKSRDSENGKSISYNVDLNKGIFTYIPSEDDALGGEESQNLEHSYDIDIANSKEVF